MAAPAHPTVPTSPWLSLRGVVCMAMLGLLGYAVWLGWERAHPPSDQPNGHTAAFAYMSILQHASFQFHLPSPRGYDVAAGMLGWQTPGPNTVMSLMYTPKGDPHGQMQLAEGTQRNPSLLHAMTGGKPAIGTVFINGLVWSEYHSSDPVLNTTLPDGIQISIRLGNSFRDEEKLAARVPIKLGG
jgi:hypothetical protein